jgi:hypothetical protein
MILHHRSSLPGFLADLPVQPSIGRRFLRRLRRGDGAIHTTCAVDISAFGKAVLFFLMLFVFALASAKNEQ